ncbi:MAG: stalk domain-containing protein [Clostridiales bacterium]|nr:stalk domain-containing protein [Clostridiales bacterium]
MKKTISLFIVILLVALCGCWANTGSRQNLKIINGISMISAKKGCALIGLEYSENDNSIELTQDKISLDINIGSPFIYRDKYIIYVMDSPAFKESNVTYLPASFFSNYLGEPIKFENHQLSLLEKKEFSIYDIVKFLPEEVLGAINDANYPNRDKILHAVELPRSMNISIPKLNLEKIVATAPLSDFSSVFKSELLQHGYSEKEISDFTYGDYKTIESSWNLSDQIITFLKLNYSDLKDKDLSKWTYGDYEKYLTAQDKKGLESRFSEAQKTKLSQKGILLEDVFYLFKDFYQIEVILAQPDNVLKEDIEAYYQFSIDSLKK